MAFNQPVRGALYQAWRSTRRLRGQEVTYSDGTNTIGVVAVKTRPEYGQGVGDENVVLNSKSWDWLIDPSELVFNGNPIVPALGHVIETIDGKQYKVQPSNNSDTAFKPSDGLSIFVRVYTEEWV